jgi:RNA polymerase sigma-70 factor (ECF subfamily)
VDLRQLLQDCLTRRSAAQWGIFVSHFNRIIQAAVLRSAGQCGHRHPDPDLTDDLVQETYLRLCANDCRVLRGFRSPDPESLYGLIRAVAISVTFDHFRARAAGKRGSGRDPVAIDPGSPNEPAGKGGPAAVEQSVLFEQIDRHLREIVPAETADRDRRIFWLYYRHGYTASDIASLPGVALSAKGVESMLHRLIRQLRKLISGFGESEKGAET